MDDNQTEGKVTAESSTSDGSPQPLTEALKALQSQMEADFDKRLKEAESRWQSDKDRRIPKLEEEQNNLRKTIEDVLKRAGSEANASEIERQIKLDRLLMSVDESGNLPVRKPDEQKNGQAVEAQRIAKELQLDMNDKDYAEAVKSGDVIGLMRVVMSKTAAPAADETNAQLLQGRTQRQLAPAELTDNYIKEMRAAPRGPKGDSQRRDIKNKYIKQGVQVHDIDFT